MLSWAAAGKDRTLSIFLQAPWALDLYRLYIAKALYILRKKPRYTINSLFRASKQPGRADSEGEPEAALQYIYQEWQINNAADSLRTISTTRRIRKITHLSYLYSVEAQNTNAPVWLLSPHRGWYQSGIGAYQAEQRAREGLSLR